MGWLGVCLLFVGIALFSNGMAALYKIDGKSLSFMNLITGCIIVLGNFIQLFRVAPTDTMGYNNIAAGFLFGFTYLFIAANYLWGLDPRAFGLFSAGVVVFALVAAASSFASGGWALGLLWIAWAILWLEGFLELTMGLSRLGKIFPYLSIAEGIFAAFIPGMLMLYDKFPM